MLRVLTPVALCLLFVCVTAQLISAQTSAPNCAADKPNGYDKRCEDIYRLQTFCTYVSSGTKDRNPISPRYKFKYQRVLLDGAGVEPTDTPDVIQKKMSAMWPKVQKYLTCTWEMSNGSFLKYGLTSSAHSHNFIFDILQWKVPLNDIDPADDKTLMDFIKDKIIYNRNTALGPILEEYYVRLREAGGKHKSELK